jgi:hypothetical protein
MAELLSVTAPLLETVYRDLFQSPNHRNHGCRTEMDRVRPRRGGYAETPIGAGLARKLHCILISYEADRSQRNFGRLPMFGFASTLICTWEIILAYVIDDLAANIQFIRSCIVLTIESCSSLSLSLFNGGTAGLFWNFIIVCLGFSVVYASIAELGSA